MKRIDGLLEEFTSGAERIERSLSSMLACVSGGRVPQGADVQSLGREVDGLQSAFDAILALSREVVSEEALPAEGASVTEYAAAIRQSEFLRRREKLAAAEQRLSRFVSVRAKNTAFETALSPYQAAARELLARLEDVSADEMEQDAPAQAMFFEALAADDFTTEAALSLTERLEEHYPSRVLYGLMQKQYYINESAAAEIPAAEPTETPTAEIEKAATEIEPAAIVEAAPAEAATEPTEPEPAAEPEATAEPKLAAEPEPDVTVSPLSKIKAKPVSASAFKSEILRLPREIRTILPMFTNLGVLTAEQVCLAGRCLGCFKEEEAKGRVQKALDALVSKSIAAGYRIPEIDAPIYCLTPYGYSSLKKQSIVGMRGFFEVSMGNLRLVGRDEMSGNALRRMVRHNRCLIDYLTCAKACLRAETYEAVKRSVAWCGEHYTVSVFAPDGEYKCTLAADDDAEALLETGNVLLCETEELRNIEIPSRTGGHALFACDGKAVYRWDGTWKAQTAAGQEAAPEDETAGEGNPPAEAAEATAPAEEEAAGEAAVESEAAVAAEQEKPVEEEIVEEEPIEEEIAADEPIEEEIAADEPIEEEIAADEPIEEAPVAEAASDGETVRSLCRALLESGETPTDERFLELICRLAAESDSEFSHLKEAVLLAKAASFGEENALSRCAYEQLALAADMGLDKRPYSGAVLAGAFDRDLAVTESCRLAAYLRAMLFPQQAHDYTLREITRSAADGFDALFPSYPALRTVFCEAAAVCDLSPEGYSERIRTALSDQEKRRRQGEELKKRANRLMDEPKIKAYITGIPEFVARCFGKQSDLQPCMKIIAADNRAEREFVSAVFAEYREDGKDISDACIDRKIDNEWKEATRGKRTKMLNLEYQARGQVLGEFTKRLELIGDWLRCSDTEATASLPAMKQQKLRLMQELRRAESAVSAAPGRYGAVVLWTLRRIQETLGGTVPDGLVFGEVLKTGCLSLDEAGVPVLDETMHAVKYAEPWRFVLEHIASEKPSFAEAARRIFDSASPTFDNLHQLEMIGRQLGSAEEVYTVTPEQTAQATDAANRATENFRGDLEFAYTYNQIYEQEKESLSALLDLYRDFYYDRREFGSWRVFLHCLRKQVKDISEERKDALRSRLAACAERLGSGETSGLLDEARELLENEDNFAVAEEYCNRFDLGERELSEERSATLHDADSFGIFLSDAVFRPLYDECNRKRGQRLGSFGNEYVKSRYPAGWTTRHKEDSRNFLSAWPTRIRVTKPEKIAEFFTGLGLNVRDAEKVAEDKSWEIFHLDVAPAPRNMADYRHPISAFGTQIRSRLPVVVIYGNRTAPELVDTIDSLNLGGMAVVLIDYHLEKKVRCEIAEISHTKKSGMNPFLIIDRVLALHLALHQESERLPVMLKCTLPYTSYQPFVRDGGPVADEMFCGRVRELATIADPNGACVVYGGRQLGKTALLERAQSLFAKPEAKAFAAYSSILKLKSEAAVVERLLTDLRRGTGLAFSDSTTLRDLCAQIDALFRKGTISRMLLLIDEADEFLGSISGEDYLPLQPLVDLKRETKNQFKFVLAGLHNVCRAKNATARNGIFGQLGQPLCVKPLSPTDALSLLSRPLQYLGFQVDRYPHLETILTNTNYYPGILQFFGYMLVQTMRSQYGKYYRAVDNNPPYTLRKEQLGAILNSADLNNSIKDKFRWSLELDSRYFMLARCVAILYYEQKGDPTASRLGFAAEQIAKTAADWSIRALEGEPLGNITNLLDEMVDMGILSRPSDAEKRYRLRRKAFINIIAASEDALLEDIDRNNGGIADV